MTHQTCSSLSTSIVCDEFREPLATDTPPSPLQSQLLTTINQSALLLNLPLELIQSVLGLCDYSTLLALAQVDMLLNAEATQIILTRELGSWSSQKFSISHDTPHRDSILAALYIRQGAKYALTDFDYSFEDSKCFRRQGAAITRFLDNHVTSIDCLKLDLASAQAGSWAEASSARSKLIMLLEAALAKGCQHVDLRGDIRCCIPHSLKPIGGDLSSPPTPPPPPPFFLDSAPTLNKLTLETSPTLDPFLLPHMLALLRSQSPTLRNLKIYQSKPLPISYYDDFFLAVSLPSLETFKVTYKLSDDQPTSSSNFECVFDFLARHPSVQKVKFHNEYPYFDPKYRSAGTDRFLPNLKILHASAQVVYSLLQYPKVFSNLEHVCIMVPYKDIRRYEQVNNALIALGSRKNDSSTCGKSSIHLELRVCFDTNFGMWLSFNHILNQDASPVQYLKRVETLTLNTKGASGMLTMETLITVVAWAGMFPNLRWLRLDDKSFRTDEVEEVIRDERFVDCLKENIPLLERCSVGDWDWVK